MFFYNLLMHMLIS